MRRSLRIGIIGISIVFLSIGFLLKHIPMSSLVGYYYFNQSITAHFNPEITGRNEKDFLILAIKANPLNYQAYRRLGFLYFDEGDYKNAISQLNIYLEMDPRSTSDLILLGDAYEKTNEYTLAVTEYEKVMVIEADNLETLKKLANLYGEMGEKKKYFSTLYQIALLTADQEEKWFVLDEMRSFSDQIELESGIPLGYGRQSSAVINENNELFILTTCKNFPNLLIITSSRNHGKTWEKSEILYVGYNLDGTLTIDHSGIIHTAFGEQDGTLFYTNSQVNFSSLLVVAEEADSRQIAIDKDMVVHIAWINQNSQILHREIFRNKIVSEIEFVAVGWHPSLSADKNLSISYNQPMVFPNSEGGVFFTEKMSNKWSTSIKISGDNTWAGASVLVTNENVIHVAFIENTASSPRLVYATRGLDGKWNLSSIDNTYFPYIPVELSFGGRTSPDIRYANNKIFFLWRAGTDKSPIVMRIFDIKSQQFEDEKVLGNLNNAPFNYAPSFIDSQIIQASPAFLWAMNGSPVIYSVETSSQDLESNITKPFPTLTSIAATEAIKVTPTPTPLPKWFRLRNQWNPYCLASMGDSKSIGNPVAMGDCNSANSLWQWDGQEIHNAWSPYCLGSKGDSKKLDNPIIMEECGNANVFWQWDGVQIRNTLNPYYLGSIGPSTLIDNPVVMGACCQANAYWYIETVP